MSSFCLPKKTKMSDIPFILSGQMLSIKIVSALKCIQITFHFLSSYGCCYSASLKPCSLHVVWNSIFVRCVVIWAVVLFYVTVWLCSFNTHFRVPCPFFGFTRQLLPPPPVSQRVFVGQPEVMLTIASPKSKFQSLIYILFNKIIH